MRAGVVFDHAVSKLELETHRILVKIPVPANKIMREKNLEMIVAFDEFS